MKIGFFDSGIGGITVLREALKLLPYEDYFYYADTLHVPYGMKPKEEVKKHILEAVEYMVGQGLKLLVVACNTATSIAIEDLRKIYRFPVIGMEPAVKQAVDKNGCKGKRILVLATSLTLKEEKFQNLVSKVDQEHIVDYLPLPELVSFAEELEFRPHVIKPYLKEKLSAFEFDNYSTVVLGCTHYPLYYNYFREILPIHVDIIDGSAGTVRHMRNIMEEKGLLKKGTTKAGEIVFHTSGNSTWDKKKRESFKELLYNPVAAR
ncbi:MAG TPA: glutamate racemase [Clostridiaceae bacterium]|nr:glutamate racemase [Clostridiaceae bacterium]